MLPRGFISNTIRDFPSLDNGHLTSACGYVWCSDVNVWMIIIVIHCPTQATMENEERK